jgi:Helix-turn-helix domain
MSVRSDASATPTRPVGDTPQELLRRSAELAESGEPSGQGHQGIADDDLLTATQVAAMFRVDRKTVGTWARAGKIVALRTSLGHRRFRGSEIDRLQRQMSP